MDLPKKPLAKLHSKDERIAFRVPEPIKVLLASAAVENGDDLSTYCRDCMLMGHTLKQSQKLLKATVG